MTGGARCGFVAWRQLFQESFGQFTDEEIAAFPTEAHRDFADAVLSS
jgi:hypothetical protein